MWWLKGNSEHKTVTFLCCFIQPADIQEIEKVVDEALALAAENQALLDHIHEVKDALDPKKMHSTCRTFSVFEGF